MKLFDNFNIKTNDGEKIETETIELINRGMTNYTIEYLEGDRLKTVRRESLMDVIYVNEYVRTDLEMVKVE